MLISIFDALRIRISPSIPVMTAAFAIFAVLNGTMYCFGVFLKPLSTEFGWDRATISGAYSTFAIVLGFSYVITGRLNDRFGPRLILSVCGLLLGLGYLLMSRITGVWQFYLVYGVIVAIGMSGGMVPLLSTVARWFVKKRGLITGIVLSGIGIGTIIFPPIANYLIERYGWRFSYVIIGAIATAVVVIMAQLLRREPNKSGVISNGLDSGSQTQHDNLEGIPFTIAIRNIKLWILGLIYFGFGFGLMSVMMHMVAHATDVGLSRILATGIIAVIGGVSIIGRISMGTLSDKIGNYPCLFIGFALQAIALFSLIWITQPTLFFVFAVVYGISYGGLIGSMSTTVAENFGVRSHGGLLGVVHFVHGFGCALGPFLSGRFFDMTGSYSLAFIACGAFALTALILVFVLTLRRADNHIPVP